MRVPTFAEFQRYGFKASLLQVASRIQQLVTLSDHANVISIAYSLYKNGPSQPLFRLN